MSSEQWFSTLVLNGRGEVVGGAFVDLVRYVSCTPKPTPSEVASFIGGFESIGKTRSDLVKVLYEVILEVKRYHAAGMRRIEPADLDVHWCPVKFEDVFKSLTAFFVSWVSVSLDKDPNLSKKIISFVIDVSTWLETMGNKNYLKLQMLQNQRNVRAPVRLMMAQPSVPRKNTQLFSVLEKASPSEIANSVTYLHNMLIQQILPQELMQKSSAEASLRPNLVFLAGLFNKISLWVVSDILNSKKPHHRIKKMIDLAEKLYKLNDFNGLLAVVSGLCNSSVERLSKYWKKVDDKHMKTKQMLEELMSPLDGHKKYKAAVAAAEKPLVPYVSLYFKELMYICDGNPVMRTRSMPSSRDSMDMLAQPLERVRSDPVAQVPSGMVIGAMRSSESDTISLDDDESVRKVKSSVTWKDSDTSSLMSNLSDSEYSRTQSFSLSLGRPRSPPARQGQPGTPPARSGTCTPVLPAAAPVSPGHARTPPLPPGTPPPLLPSATMPSTPPPRSGPNTPVALPRSPATPIPPELASSGSLTSLEDCLVNCYNYERIVLLGDRIQNFMSLVRPGYQMEMEDDSIVEALKMYQPEDEEVLYKLSTKVQPSMYGCPTLEDEGKEGEPEDDARMETWSDVRVRQWCAAQDVPDDTAAMFVKALREKGSAGKLDHGVLKAVGMQNFKYRRTLLRALEAREKETFKIPPIYYKHVSEWSNEDCRKWFRAIGIEDENFLTALKTEDVVGTELMELNKDRLLELKMTVLKHRKEAIKALQLLRKGDGFWSASCEEALVSRQASGGLIGRNSSCDSVGSGSPFGSHLSESPPRGSPLAGSGSTLSRRKSMKSKG